MGRLDDPWVVDNAPSRRYPLYTRGNVGEVFPDPVTPLSWTLAGIPGAEPGWRDALERFGSADHSEFDPDSLEILGVFGGYCYLNVSVTRIFAVRTPGLTPEVIDVQLFGEQPGMPPYVAADGDESPAHTERIQRTLQWLMTTPSLPELEEEQAAVERLRAERPDIPSMSNEALLARTREITSGWFRRLFAQHIYTTYCASVPAGIIQQVCTELGDPTLTTRLIGWLGGFDSAAPSWAMWRLGRLVAASPALTEAFDAGVHDGLQGRIEGLQGDDVDAFRRAFDDFLYAFGSRGFNEWEMSSPTWETDHALAFAAIDRMRGAPDEDDPQVRHERIQADREQLAPTLIEQLAGNPEVQQQFAGAIHAAAVFLPGRERTKTTIIRLTHEGRMMMSELGRRMVEAGHFDDPRDFAMLRDDEYDDFLADPTGFSTVVKERRAWYQELAEREPPFIVVAEPTRPATWPRRDAAQIEGATSGQTLVGLPGCPGQATGRARVILDPCDPAGLEPGDILVAPLTDPAWTPLFVPAAAVVVDVGAALSHAIIVSRELGIPCVVSVTGATRAIPDGAMVTVDGTTGTVSLA